MKNLWLIAGLGVAIFFVASAANPLLAENAVVGDIKVVGNEKTKADVILSEIMIKPGDALDETTLREIQRRVMNLQYFIGVDVKPEPVADSNKVNIIITVKERQTWGIYPIVTLTSDTENSDNEFGLEVTENDLQGLGNVVSGNVRQIGDYQGLSLSYYNRHLVYSNFTLGAGFSMSKDLIEWDLGNWGKYENDVDIWSLYVQTGYWFSYEFRTTLGISTRDASYTGSTVVPIYGRTDKVYLTLNYYNVDYTLYAYQGPSVYLTLQKGFERPTDRFSDLTNGDDYGYTKIYGGITYYWNTYKDHIFRISANYGTSNDAPWWDGFSVGGNGSVRGYPGGTMYAEDYTQATLEYRIPVAVRQKLFAGYTGTFTVLPFFDAGYAWSEGMDRDFGDAIMGAGIGFRLYIHEMQAGTVALDIAQGFDDDYNGDLNFYLSFGAIY